MFLYEAILFVVGIFHSRGYEDLSHGKHAMQSTTATGGWYGAGNAVDGNVTTCMRTKEMGPKSPYKTVWWKVDLGGVYNIYSVNILFKNYDGYEMRQQGRFAGFLLFVSNDGNINGSSLCYKNELQLPPLNFTTTCTASGRYIIFYNERLDDKTYPEGYEVLQNYYTELCEVVAIGCTQIGVYGASCNVSCPDCCRNNICDIQNGNCFVCKAGWEGDRCNIKCHEGWYGTACAQQCVGHCKNSACHHVTGQCDAGCAAGWTGSLCNETCEDGTFGLHCIQNCSSHCLNESVCNTETGHCNKGCDSGYFSQNCSLECPLGYFGVDCQRKCSGHCVNSETCYHIDGACLGGCQDGYTGKQCNATCKDGLYGRNCSDVCSKNCKSCHYTDGCVCPAGYTGSNCSDVVNSSSDGGLTDGEIAGVVLGVLLSSCFFAVLLFFVMRFFRNENENYRLS